jgi:hypothetical protein
MKPRRRTSPSFLIAAHRPLLSFFRLVRWNRSDVKMYFSSPWAVYTDGIGGGLFTFLLFWTLVYGMVHVY